MKPLPLERMAALYAHLCGVSARRIGPMNARYDREFRKRPKPGSEAELVAALRRFLAAVQREPGRALVRYLHS